MAKTSRHLTAKDKRTLAALYVAALLMVGAGAGWLWRPAAGLLAAGLLFWFDLTFWSAR